MTGLPPMAKGERLGRFREFVEIVHRLLSGETVTREGGYYPVTGAVMNPRPVQQPLAVLDDRRRRAVCAQSGGGLCGSLGVVRAAREEQDLGPGGDDGPHA